MLESNPGRLGGKHERYLCAMHETILVNNDEQCDCLYNLSPTWEIIKMKLDLIRKWQTCCRPLGRGRWPKVEASLGSATVSGKWPRRGWGRRPSSRRRRRDAGLYNVRFFLSSTSQTAHTYFSVCLIDCADRIFPPSYAATRNQTHVR